MSPHPVRRRWTIAALAAAVLLAVAAVLVLGRDSSSGADPGRANLKLKLSDGSSWTGSVYLAHSGRTVCLTSPPRDHARWAGPGCLSGAFLARYVRTDPPPLIGAVGVVRGADGKRNAVVYGYTYNHWRVRKVASDTVPGRTVIAKAIHLSSRTLTLPVVVSGRASAARSPSRLVLQPFAAVLPLTDPAAAGEAYVYAIGPDRHEQMHHFFPTT